MRLVLCIDPGETTGVAIVGLHPGSSTPTLLWGDAWEVVDSNVYEVVCPKFKFAVHVVGLCEVVIIESFVGGSGGRLQTLTCKTIGVCEALAWNAGLPIREQPPGARTAYLSQALQSMISYGGIKSKHIKDAAAHGFRYFAEFSDASPYLSLDGQ